MIRRTGDTTPPLTVVGGNQTAPGAGSGGPPPATNDESRVVIDSSRPDISLGQVVGGLQIQGQALERTLYYVRQMIPSETMRDSFWDMLLNDPGIAGSDVKHRVARDLAMADHEKKGNLTD